MNAAKAAVAVILSTAFALFGIGIIEATTAGASPQAAAESADHTPYSRKPHCQPPLSVPTLDRNGRWYCKYVPAPGRHNRHDRERAN